MMKKYFFNIISIVLVIFTQLTFEIMGSIKLLDSLSDDVYYFIYDCTQIIGGILGVVVLWHYGFREIFRFHFKRSYLVWLPVMLSLHYLWTQVVMSYIVDRYGDDSLIAIGPSASLLAIQVGSRYFYNAVFMAPFVEEVFYRGIAFSILSKYKKYHLDLLVSSAMFSIAHFWYLGWSNMDFLNYLVPGLMMGLYFKKTNCIYYTMIYHMFVNAFPYLMGWR